MPNVTVSQPNTIKVTVGSATNPRIQSTATFSGAVTANITSQVQYATDTANTAYALANTALQTTGGEITGNLLVDGTFKANIDGGLF
jgi:hypothetical protein